MLANVSKRLFNLLSSAQLTRGVTRLITLVVISLLSPAAGAQGDSGNQLAIAPPADQAAMELKLSASADRWIRSPSLLGDADPGDPAKSAVVEPQGTPGWTTILSETAEGSFPADNSWDTQDNNSTGGLDYWDDLSCRSYAGSWSIWCADIGDQTDCGTYDNDMNSWMIFGPFSLADASAARAELRLWSETERPDIPYDYVFWGASINGVNYNGQRLTANTGWSLRELDFGNVPTLGDLTGQPNVWFAVVFNSDSTVNNFEGAYVDNILIEKQVSAQPDMQAVNVYFRDQPAGGGSVVTNPTPSDVLYPHFDYNINDASVTGKLWQLNLNGSFLCSFTTATNVSPGGWIGYCNSPISLGAGVHSLHGEVDPDGTIPESNESNNNTFRNYTVSDPNDPPDIRIEPLSLSFTESRRRGVSGTAAGSTLVTSRSDVATYQLFNDDGEVLAQHFERLAELTGQAEKAGSVRVIVGLDMDFEPEGRRLDEQAVVAQRQAIRDLQDELLAGLSGLSHEVVVRYEYIPFLALELSHEAMVALAAFPEVSSIAEDVALPPLMASSNLVIGSPTAWGAGFTGTGLTVAVLDTGVDKSHSFFSTGGSKVVSEACYSTTGGSSTSVCPGGVGSSTASGSGVNCSVSVSGCNHGTHVAGTVAGDNVTGPNFGVGRGSDLIAIQVFSRFDSAATCSPSPAPCVLSYVSDQVRGLERVFALRTTYDIAAANMSLGGGQYFTQAACDAANTATKAAIDNLRSVGIATVIAAGNSGYRDSMGSPGCISTAVSVGATTDGDAVASFSNVATFLDLLAPGVSINSSVPGGGTSNFNGTSMASPHVAGAWAVLQQASPGLSVDDVLSTLRTTATSVDDNRSGGSVNNMRRINLDQAVAQVTTGVTQSFTISNDGDLTLNVTAIALDASASWISWSPAAPFSIGGGGSQQVTVTVDFGSAPPGQSTRRLLVYSNDANESPYPGGVFVTVNTPSCAIPGTPALVSPANGSTTGDNTPFFNWNSAASSDQYQIQVDDSPGFGSPAINLFRTSSNYTVTSPLVDDTYWWRVRGRNTAGSCNVYGSWSSVRNLTIATGPPPGSDRIGAYRPPNRLFLMDVDGSGTWNPPADQAAQFGVVGDLPITGDWNGDGDDDIGVYRPANRLFLLDVDESGSWTPPTDVAYQMGVVGDVPLIGDWNGDGDDDIGVYRPASRLFLLDLDESGSWTPVTDQVYLLGLVGDVPLIGDWNGDGDDDIGIYRPSNRVFLLDSNENGAYNPGVDLGYLMGLIGDTPLAGDWNGDGDDNIGIYRPSNRVFLLDFDEGGTWTPATDLGYSFGLSGDQPLTGAW